MSKARLATGLHLVHRLSRNDLMLSHVQATFFTPVYSAGRVAGRSSVVVYMAITETRSSLAVFTSQIAPVAFAVFLLTKAIIPSHPLMRERHCVFHFSSNGSLTDMLVNSNGLLPSFACPIRCSFAHLSSMAKLIKMRYFVANFVSPAVSSASYIIQPQQELQKNAASVGSQISPKSWPQLFFNRLNASFIRVLWFQNAAIARN